MEGTLRLRIEYEAGENGWVIAQIPAVPGAMSQGRTRDEARENVLDALQLLLSPEPAAEAGEGESVKSSQPGEAETASGSRSDAMDVGRRSRPGARYAGRYGPQMR